MSTPKAPTLRPLTEFTPDELREMAERGDTVFDVLVAIYIMGWPQIRRGYTGTIPYPHVSIDCARDDPSAWTIDEDTAFCTEFHPSTDPAAMWEVRKKVQEWYQPYSSDRALAKRWDRYEHGVIKLVYSLISEDTTSSAAMLTQEEIWHTPLAALLAVREEVANHVKEGR